MTGLYVLAAFLLLFAGIGALAYRAGSRMAQGRAAAQAAAMKDRQLEAAANAPHGKGEILKRIKEGGM